jgi:hypothetical protein
MSSTVLLMTDNFLSPNVVSHSYVSSQQSAFPIDNVYNAQRRSKVWRSAGHWDISSGSNTIVFRETALVNLTATITPGAYASDALFFAAIKSALQTEGASTYTITRDTTTTKVKIASNGLGGGGIFELMWTSSPAMASLLGYSSLTNDTGALTYTADVLRIHSSEWVKWDMGISTNPKAFILIDKRNAPIPITPSATLLIQGNETDVWTSPSYSKALTYDDSAIAEFSDTGLHTEALRYWRLSIVDASNPTGFIEIGSLFLGDYFLPSRGRVQFPFRSRYVDRSTTSFSEGGQTFSDIKEKTEEFTIEWFGLTVDEKEELDRFWLNYGTSIPFFVAFDTNAVFSSTANKYVRYVKFSTEPDINLTSPGVFTCAMALREEL